MYHGITITAHAMATRGDACVRLSRRECRAGSSAARWSIWRCATRSSPIARGSTRTPASRTRRSTACATTCSWRPRWAGAPSSTARTTRWPTSAPGPTARGRTCAPTPSTCTVKPDYSRNKIYPLKQVGLSNLRKFPHTARYIADRRVSLSLHFKSRCWLQPYRMVAR